ncbi:MAG TPA: MFS transporter [Gemmatimonadaceae bacterium]
MHDAAASRRPAPVLLALGYLAFVSLGLPDAVPGVAWPSVRDAFDLPQAALGAAIAAGAVASFLSGMVAGRLVDRLGIGALLAASTALAALGVAGFAAAPAFVVFLLAATIVGFGSGAVDAGLNAYAAHHFPARHMTWLHAAYSVGAAIGPALMTAVLARGASWRAGYAVIAATLALLAAAYTAARHRWAADAPRDAAVAEAAAPPPLAGGASALLRRPRLWLQLALFVVYAGLEVVAGQWSYTVLVEARGATAETAGALVTLYWSSLLAGRVLLGFVVERIGPVRLLRLGTLGAVCGAALVALPTAPLAVAAAGLATLGFSIAPIFPALMGETPRRIGRDVATHAVGFQISSATLGVALLPAVAGVLGQRLGLDAIPIFVVVCALLFLALHETLVAVADR